MPESQAQQRVESLEKVEGYLKKQVSELEEDRQQLYDLLRDDKKSIHEMKIKLRSVELSEDNYKRKLDQMSDAETKLMEDKDELEGRVRELELELSLLAKKASSDKNTETVAYESEAEKKLKEELEQLKLENNKLKDYIEELKNIKPQMENKSFDTNDDFPHRNETKELLSNVEDLKAQLENDKTNHTLQLAKAEKEIEKLKAEIIISENTGKSQKEKLESFELQNLQMSVKIATLEKQLKDMRTAKLQEPVSEPIEENVEVKKPPADKSKDKRKLLNNLASIMASMDDPNYVEKKKEDLNLSHTSKDQSEDIKKLQLEIEQLKKDHIQLLQEKEDEYEGELEKLQRDVAGNVRGREKELIEKAEELEDQLRKKAGHTKMVQTDDLNKIPSSVSVKVQSDESTFDVPALKKAQTQTSILEYSQPTTSNASNQTEDVEIRELVYNRSRNTQTDLEEDEIGRKFFKSQFTQTEDDEEKEVRSREVQVDFEDEGIIKVSLKGKGTQTSVDEDDGGSEKINFLQKGLVKAENQIKIQEEEAESLRRDLSDKEKRLKTQNKEIVQQTAVINDLSRDQKSSTDKYIFLLEACKQDNRNLEGELENMNKIIERKSRKDGEKEKEKEIMLAETFQRLRVTEEDLHKTENHFISEQEQQTELIASQAGGIESLKKIVAEKDEEVKCLWADLKKMQKNYTNYVDASEKDCLQLEKRVKELEKMVVEEREEVKRLSEELQGCVQMFKRQKGEWNETVDKHTKSQAEWSALKKVVTEKDAEVRMLITDLNGLQAKFAGIVQEHENCEKNDIELRKVFEECKVDLRQAMDRNMEQSRQLEMKTNKLNILLTTNEDLMGKNKLNEVEVDELKNKVQTIELKSEFVNSSNEQRMRVVASGIMREKNAKMNEENVSSVQISFLKKTIQGKDEEIKLLTDDLNNMHKRYLDMLQKHPADDDSSSKDHRNKLVERLKNELERKDEENTALLNNQNSQHVQYQTLFDNKEKEKTDFVRERALIGDDLKQKSKKLEDKGKQLESLSRQLEDLQNENESQAKTISDLKMKLIQVGNALKTSSLQNKELLTQCKSDQRSKNEMNERGKELSVEKNKCDVDIASLKHKLDNSLKSLKSMSDTQTTLKEQLARAKTELSQKQDVQSRVNSTLTNLQEKENQLQILEDEVKGLRKQSEEMQNDKKEHQKTEHLLQLLRKEYDGLATYSKKQSSKLKDLQTKDKLITSQLRDKESELKNMNAELERCSELSRRLNILSVNR